MTRAQPWTVSDRFIALIDYFLGNVSTKHALNCGKGLGILSYSLHERGRTRHYIHHMVSSVFNLAEDSPDVDVIVKKYFSHLGQLVVEVARTKHLRRDWNDIIEIRGIDHLHEAVKCGRGTILLSAHLGNWEYIISGLPLLTGVSNSHVIAWKQPDSYFHRLVDERRRTYGTRLLYSQDIPIPRRSGRGLIDNILNDNGIVLILADHYGNMGNTTVNFFGHQTHVAPGPFLFAKRNNAAVLSVHTIRRGQRHIVAFEPSHDLEPLLKEEGTAADYLQRYMTGLEQRIRNDPEQYMWHLKRRAWARKSPTPDPLIH